MNASANFPILEIRVFRRDALFNDASANMLTLIGFHGAGVAQPARPLSPPAAPPPAPKISTFTSRPHNEI